MDALFSRAARLFKVDFVEPETVIAKNTASSLQSGLVYGFAGQVDGIVERIRGRARCRGADGRHRRPGRPDRPARAHARDDRPVPDARRHQARLAAQSRMNVYEWGRRGDPALLYWDGLGGTGLHANEIGPLLAGQYGLHVVAPDPPGHGGSPSGDADSFRPTRLAESAAVLLLSSESTRAAFLGFSWAARVGRVVRRPVPRAHDGTRAASRAAITAHGSRPGSGRDRRGARGAGG